MIIPDKYSSSFTRLFDTKAIDLSLLWPDLESTKALGNLDLNRNRDLELRESETEDKASNAYSVVIIQCKMCRTSSVVTHSQK